MTDLPQPGPELDALVLEKIEGFPRKKMFSVDYSTDLHYIPSGKPRRTHTIDERPVPRFSRDDATALAALERFADKHGVWWEIQRAPGRYSIALRGENMPLYAQTAPTLAHAIVLALLATVEGAE